MLADMRITAITPIRRDPNRATIKVEGKAVATLSFKGVTDLGLEVGRPWDSALAQRVTQAAAVEKAMRQAMNRLNRRMLSRKELDRKLRDLEYDEPVRQRVLDRLVELGVLNDRLMGQALIRETMARKPAGPRLLSVKLAQKGIERNLADELVREAVDHDDQIEQAIMLSRKRLRTMQRLDAQTQKRRLYGLLARRGFTPDTITAAMSAVESEAGEY